MTGSILTLVGGTTYGLVALCLVAVTIVLDVVSLSIPQWMVGYGYSYGLFKVCSDSACTNYGDHVLRFTNDEVESFYYHGLRTAATMLLLVLFLLVAATVLIVLSGLKKKKTLLLIASFLCIQSITFNGIGVGVYHSSFTLVKWFEPQPSVGAGFVLACVLPIICFPAAAVLILAYRSFPSRAI